MTTTGVINRRSVEKLVKHLSERMVVKFGGFFRNLYLSVWLKQVLCFGLVGVLNTLIDVVLYLLLTHWLGLADLPVLAKAVSYAAGIMNSYFCNRKWTFRSQSSLQQSLLPFVLTNLVALGLNATVMAAAVNRWSLPEGVSFIAATAVSWAWNFSISKFLIFRKQVV